MDEQRRETDFNRLQSLLDNSGDSGTELIASVDSDLMESGLVQLLYLDMPGLGHEGPTSAARFLQSVIAPLEAAKDSAKLSATPQEYLAFLGEVLQAVACNPEPQQVYPLLSANLDKLDQHFAQLLRSWATAVLPEAEPIQARRIAAQIGNLSIMIGRFPLGSRANNLEIEIAGYEVVATVFTREGFSQQWATLQNNLGNAYSDRLKGKRAENLEKAIACFENALQVRTPQEYPEPWATLQNNLGNAYSDRLAGDPAQNLELAIACYQKALRVRTRDAFPREWATTQNNLGRAYSRRIKGDREENLELAIACYQSALQVYNRKSYPRRWATTQNNLANAYTERLRGNRAENLEQAIECYQRSLQVRTREALPVQWATTQNNLGRAFSERIKGNRAENLEAALVCYRSALQIHSRRKFPDRWATIQISLGRVFCQRVKGDRVENIEAAIASYQKALQIYNRRKFPDRWAMLQTCLGRALSEHLKGEKSRNLQSAIVCYQNALSVYTRESSSERWAMLQTYMGRAFYELMRIDRAENFKRAIACYEKALQVYTRDLRPHDHAKTLYYQGLACHARGELLLAYNIFTAAVETVEFLRGDGGGMGTEENGGNRSLGSDRALSLLKPKLAKTWTQLYKSLVELCLELAAAQPQYFAKALEYVERYKARSFVEHLVSCRLTLKADVPQYVQDELALLRQEITTEQQRQERGAKQTPNSQAIVSLDRQDWSSSSLLLGADFRRLNQLWLEFDTWISREIGSVDPLFSAAQKVEPILFEQILEVLPDQNTVLIEWAYFGDLFAAFVILPDAQYPLVLTASPKDAKALEQWAEEYLTAHSEQKGRWINQLPVRLNRLAELLEIDRLISCIPEQCDQLILVPHHFLHLIPLHALPLGQHWDGTTEEDALKLSTVSWDFNQASHSGPLSPTPTYLIDRFPRGIRYAPSSQLLRLSQLGRRTLRSALPLRHLFTMHHSTKDLIYSRLEVSTIRQYFTSAQVLEPKDSVKEVLYQMTGVSDLTEGSLQREQSQQGMVAHFACHGLINFASPWQSALFLGKESLSLEEIFNLDFRPFRLVTLSACETGSGDIKTLLNYLSLSVGLLYAGAPTIVSSLWRVSDVSTLFLMSKFYENLSLLPRVQVGDIAIALNSAQKWLRELTSEEFEVLLSDFKGQIVQIFAQLPQGPRLIAEASLQQTRNRKPCPFANPYHWAAFTTTGL